MSIKTLLSAPEVKFDDHYSNQFSDGTLLVDPTNQHWISTGNGWICLSNLGEKTLARCRGRIVQPPWKLTITNSGKDG